MCPQCTSDVSSKQMSLDEDDGKNATQMPSWDLDITENNDHTERDKDDAKVSDEYNHENKLHGDDEDDAFRVPRLRKRRRGMGSLGQSLASSHQSSDLERLAVVTRHNAPSKRPRKSAGTLRTSLSTHSQSNVPCCENCDNFFEDVPLSNGSALLCAACFEFQVRVVESHRCVWLSCICGA
jgi:hypothetical protein